jgi:hypothetical protein
MRSALDNLVCGLIRTKDSWAVCKGTRFPIRTDAKTWNDNCEKDLKGVEPGARRIIKDLQPCFRMPSSPEDDHLNVLNVLCNSDKHRAVTFTMAYSHDLIARVHANDGKIHVAKATKPLYAGYVHAVPLDLDPSTIETSARVETSGTEVLVIREIGPWGDRPGLAGPLGAP